MFTVKQNKVSNSMKLTKRSLDTKKITKRHLNTKNNKMHEKYANTTCDKGKNAK